MNGPMFTYQGIHIYCAPRIPRYTLPEEIIPGVPWPPGFREEINAWALDFLGWTCLVPRGEGYMIGKNTLIVHPHSFYSLRSAVGATVLRLA